MKLAATSLWPLVQNSALWKKKKVILIDPPVSACQPSTAMPNLAVLLWPLITGTCCSHLSWYLKIQKCRNTHVPWSASATDSQFYLYLIIISRTGNEWAPQPRHESSRFLSMRIFERQCQVGGERWNLLKMVISEKASESRRAPFECSNSGKTLHSQ